MAEADDGFLSRWSRLKQQARQGHGTPERPGTAAPQQALAEPAPVRPDPAGTASAPDSGGAAQPPGQQAECPLTEEDFTDADFAALDARSDYTRFMGDKVPAAIRQKALAKLWTSDPVFAGLDPIHDYHGDYTDAAVAVKEGLATAYRVGRGFLNDDEVAAWERLGQPDKPPAAEVAAESAPPAFTAGIVAEPAVEAPEASPPAVAAASAAEAASEPPPAPDKATAGKSDSA